MTPVLIIGYGNPLRSDDGIGWQAARALLTEWSSSKVRVESSHQLLPEMAEWIADAQYVVFIDACWDSIPGRIRLHAVHPEETKTISMMHHFSPEGLLADAWHLYHLCPEAVMVSVGGGSFEHGEKLSESTASALPAVLNHVRKLVQKHFAKMDVRKVGNHA